MREKSEIFILAHKRAKQLVNDSYKLSYRKALSEALKTLWYDSKKTAQAKTAFTKEEKSLILASLSNHNTLKLYYHLNNELIEKLIPYSYKNWNVIRDEFNPISSTKIEVKIHQFYFSQEIINQFKF